MHTLSKVCPFWLDAVEIKKVTKEQGLAWEEFRTVDKVACGDREDSANAVSTVVVVIGDAKKCVDILGYARAQIELSASFVGNKCQIFMLS